MPDNPDDAVSTERAPERAHGVETKGEVGERAVTIPAAMKLVEPSVRNHKNGVGPICWEAVAVRRDPLIPQPKFAAVRTVLASHGRGRLLVSNALPRSEPFVPTAKEFRIQFAVAKDDAALTAFLNEVETAVTT